ncbi:MAG: DNA glycosylase [Actinobacteria bacterium 69-20]|nr:Fpg/Nei family DNA glycosylase [Actinomycetota bacterium]OJV29570.1 MAG: DNA glycosylase [Actinobacteria bacterium 69-20]
MPEGHVLHRLAHSVMDEFGGRPVTSSSPQGRFSSEAAEITGHVLADAEAYGKHLFITFHSVPRHVHVHLGMAGRMEFGAGDPPPPRDTIRWRMVGDHGYTDLRGPAACELLDESGMTKILAKLGPDPLRDDADPDIGWAKVHRAAKPVAALLMDQAVTAGVGNIFRAEVLYRHHIDPHMPGKLLTREEWDAIWDDLVELMHKALSVGRIDTVYPEHMPEAMGRPPRVDPHGGEVYVYRRAGQQCYVCGSDVLTEVLEGRNLFWCPTCQPKTRRRLAP